MSFFSRVFTSFKYYYSSLYLDGVVTRHSLDFQPTTHINISLVGWVEEPISSQTGKQIFKLYWAILNYPKKEVLY